ncbi:MAG TPA: hypothetical protein PLA50_18350, partial [Bacteroidia bacterium]|nr:hypothetical protein [Bacteroidia bacterium]
MAKKKRKKTGGGGAFGKAGAKRLPQADGFDYDRIEWRYIDRDRNTTMDLIRHWNALSDSDPRVIEAMESSLILDAINEGVLETPPAFQARRVLDRIHHEDEEPSPEEIQAAVDEALAIDPDSIDVRLFLAEQADTAEAVREHNREAVAVGEARLAGKLKTGTPPEGGWAEDMEVLPYLHALLRYAECCRTCGDSDGAVEGFRRLIALDPDDALDAIPTLSGLYLARNEFEEAARLIESSPNRNSCAVLFDQAYLAFFAALEAESGFEPDMEQFDPFEPLKTPEMERARTLLHEAIRRSPWTVPFVFDCRSAMLGPLVEYEEGSPFEALEYARTHFAPWTLVAAPAIWLNAECSRIFERLDRRHLRHYHADFAEALAWLDEIERPYDLFEDQAMKDICEAFGG